MANAPTLTPGAQTPISGSTAPPVMPATTHTAPSTVPMASGHVTSPLVSTGALNAKGVPSTGHHFNGNGG